MNSFKSVIQKNVNQTYKTNKPFCIKMEEPPLTKRKGRFKDNLGDAKVKHLWKTVLNKQC